MALQTRNGSNTGSQLRRQAERLLSTEISFVLRMPKGEQAAPAIADLESFFASIQNAEIQAASDRSNDHSLLPVPAHLLSKEQEQQLFLQMNYLKYRANALRSRIDPACPSRRTMQSIESMLADAKRIREYLVEFNLRLVLSIARDMSNSQNQFEELASEGMPILIRCVELFDASRGYRFSTYVTHSIQRHLYRTLQRIQRRRQRFVATDTEILGNVVEQREEEVDRPADPAVIIARILKDVDPKLDPRERLIIQRRFGLDGQASQTLRQIAADLGISKERVRQLQIRAMDKLQEVASVLNLDPDQI